MRTTLHYFPDGALRGGADIVIHMAALLFGLGWQDYLEANCRAAQCMAAAFRASPSSTPSNFSAAAIS